MFFELHPKGWTPIQPFGVFRMAKYDEQFKLLAVGQYLSNEFSYREVANDLNIEDSILRRWVASYQIHGLPGLSKKRDSSPAGCALLATARGRRGASAGKGRISNRASSGSQVRYR
jgi:transposase-like protein